MTQQESIIDLIDKNIRETSCFYNLENKHTIDSKEITQLNNNLLKKGQQDLSNLNYKIDSIVKKKRDREEIRQLSKGDKAKKKTTSIITDNEIDLLDNYSKPWNRLDNWQKKMKITEYVDNNLNKDQEILQQLLDILNKGNLRKKTKNLVYDPETEKILTLNLSEILTKEG